MGFRSDLVILRLVRLVERYAEMDQTAFAVIERFDSHRS